METNRDNLEKIDLGSIARKMTSPDPRIRAAALDELRAVNKHHIQSKEILGILIDSLHKERDPQILSRLTKLIGRLGNSAVIPLVKEFLWHDDLRVVANTLEGLSHIYSLDIIPIVQPFLNSEDNRIKANAASVLYNMNAALALEKLREMVRSDEMFFRDSGVFILGSIGDERCLEELIEVLLGENDSEILKKAIHALTRKGTEATLKSLRQVNLTSLEQFRARYVEQIVSGITSRIGRQDKAQTPQGVVDLAELHRLLVNGDNEERVRACQQLVEAGNTSSLTLLRDACNDSATSVRYNAKKAINAIQRRGGGTIQPDAQFTHRVVEKRVLEEPRFVSVDEPDLDRMEEIDMVFLVLDLNNETATVRAEAVSKLMFADRHTRGAQEAIGYLRDRLSVETDPLVKSQIVRVMGKLGDREVVPFLRQILEDETSDFRVKANALEGLGYIIDPEIFQVIVPYLSDTDNRIKANAIIAAWNHDKDSTFRIISEMLDDTDVNMRDSAAYCLVILKPRDRKAIDRIRGAFIREMEPDVIAKLADCLASLGDEQMLDEFRQMVSHASELKRPYLQDIVERIHSKLDGAGTIPPTPEDVDEVIDDLDEHGGEETVEREPRILHTLPDTPETLAVGDGLMIPLRAPEAHMLEFNHPDEMIRLNSLEALSWYLTNGLPERLFGQVDMLLSLALNDQSLRVRKRAFDTYQLIRQKDYTLVQEVGS